MSDALDVITSTIQELLARRGVHGVEFRPEANLFDDLGLDSLEVAEMSAILEEKLGSDPFSSGLAPETVAEISDFYPSAPA